METLNSLDCAVKLGGDGAVRLVLKDSIKDSTLGNAMQIAAFINVSSKQSSKAICTIAPTGGRSTTFCNVFILRHNR